MRHSRVIVVALCGVLLLAGCGGGGDDDGGDNPEGGAGTPAATNAPEETATPEPTTEDALAEQTVEARDGSDVTVDIAVLALRVQGELATLELSFTPHDPDAATDAEYAVQDLHGTPSGVLMTLVDPVNLKRYLVVRDSDENALETNLALAVAPADGTVRSEHTFAAPPPDVAQIDVSVGDWTTFRDVPIER